QSFTVENNPLTPEESFEVTVRNTNETEVSNNSIDIAFKDPNIIFYETSASRTFWRKGSSAGFRTNARNFGLLAVPFFASFSKLSDIAFDWSLNGAPLTSLSQEKPNSINLELPDRGRSATIKIGRASCRESA